MKGDEKVRSTYGLHIKHKQQQHNVLEHETKQLLQKKKINKTRCGDCARCEMFKTTVVGKEKLINTKKKQTTTKNKAKYYLNIKLNIVLMNQLKKDTSNIYS